MNEPKFFSCQRMSTALSHEPFIQPLNIIPMSAPIDQKQFRDSKRLSNDAIHVTEFIQMILEHEEDEVISLERDSFSTISSAMTSANLYSAPHSRMSSARSDSITESVSGYLYKLIGSGVMKRWKKRFIMLHGSTLFCYESNKRNDSPQEILHLSSKATVTRMDVKGKFAFSIQAEKQCWVLSGEDNEERHMWLRAVDRAQTIHRYSNDMPLPNPPRQSSVYSNASSAMSSLKKRQAELRKGLSVDTKPLPKIPEHEFTMAFSTLDMLEERFKPQSPFSQLQFFLHSA